MSRYPYSRSRALRLVLGLCYAATFSGIVQAQDLYDQALTLFKQNRYRQAIERVEDILVEDSTCVECYELLGRIASAEKKDSLAVTWYRKALALDDNNGRLYRELGLSEYQAGRSADAINSFQNSIELNPYDAEGHFLLGNVWFDLDELELAQEHYLSAVALDSTGGSYHFQLGLVYMKMKKLEPALSHFRSAYRVYPKNSLAYQYAASILIRQRRWAEVISVLELALGSAPETRVTRYWLGKAYVEVGQFEQAVELLASFVAKNPEHVGASYNLGLALYETGEYASAVNHLQFVVKNRSDLLKAQLYLGRSLDKLDRDTAALAVYDSVLAVDSTYYDAWIGKGDIHLKRNRFDEAFRLYNHAVYLNSGRWEGYHRQALLYYYQERYTLAELLLFSALSRRDSVADIYELMGDVAVGMNEDDFSSYYYAKALQLDPGKSQIRLKLVEALYRREQWVSAAEHLTRLFVQQPGDESLLYRLGWVFNQVGDTSRANRYQKQFLDNHLQRRKLEQLQLRIAYDEKNPMNYRELGFYYAKYGEHQRSREYFHRAVSLGDSSAVQFLEVDHP